MNGKELYDQLYLDDELTLNKYDSLTLLQYLRDMWYDIHKEDDSFDDDTYKSIDRELYKDFCYIVDTDSELYHIVLTDMALDGIAVNIVLNKGQEDER